MNHDDRSSMPAMLAEAVDPRTVAPGEPGRNTERSTIPRGSQRWRDVMRECVITRWGDLSKRAAGENVEMAADLAAVEVVAVGDEWITLGCRDVAVGSRLVAAPNLASLQKALERYSWDWAIRVVLLEGELRARETVSQRQAAAKAKSTRQLERGRKS